MVAAPTRTPQTLSKAKTPHHNETGLNQAFEVIEVPPCNEAALEMLAKRKNRYSIFFAAMGTAGLGLASIGVTPALLLALSASYKVADGITKCTRLEEVLKLLLVDKFKDLRIEAFPLLPTKVAHESEYVDLYIRFPERTQIFITLRSEEGRSVIYNEAKEKLQVKKGKKRGIANMRPCPLTILNKGKNWLNRNRKTFGLSSRQVTKVPTIRLLVLWGDTALLEHRNELYTSVGNNKYLAVQKDGATTFVVKKEDMIAFIEDWLSTCHK